VARDAGRKRLRVVIVVGVVLAVFVAIAGALVSPAFDVDRVEVVGAQHTSDAAVRETMGLTGPGHAMIAVDRFSLARRVESLPWVETAEVTRRWPNVVRVTLRERTPVATVAVPGGVAVIDTLGRVLATASSPPAGTIPVETTGSIPGPGERAPDSVHGAVRILRALSTSLAGKAQAMRVLAGKPPAYDLVLKGGVILRLGDASGVPQKLAAAEAVLAAEHAPGTVIDVRVPRSPAVTHGAPSSKP
jgi:cell division protein FtsQ